MKDEIVLIHEGREGHEARNREGRKKRKAVFSHRFTESIPDL